MTKIVIDIPNYNLNDIHNGSIACGQVLKAVKNGKPYEERLQGEWIMDNEHTKNPLLWYKCNLCGVYHSPTNFCPNCGAEMRGKRDG